MCEHEWEDTRDHRRCAVCNKVRLTVQAFQDGKALVETVAMIPALSEQEAVDYFLRFARIDLRYRFLGEHGFVQPSQQDYLIWQETENG